MDHYAPTPSFRIGRPLTRTRPRARAMSPSPRPTHLNLRRRSFADSSTMFITPSTDYNNMFSPSSPDSDLIFSMSPVHTHFYPPPPPNSEPVNVMTLRNKTPTTVEKQPPLSPLLYTFPRPSRLHPYMNKSADSRREILSKPLSAISQNTGTPTIDHRVRRVASSDVAAPQGVPTLSDSLLARSSTPPSSKVGTKESSLASPSSSHSHITHSSFSSSPLRAYSSSPIPIPHHTPRQSDPGVYDLVPSVSASHSPPPIYLYNGTPIPSSGLIAPTSPVTVPLPHSNAAPASVTQIEFETDTPPSSESAADPHVIPIERDMDLSYPAYDHDAFYKETSIQDTISVAALPDIPAWRATVVSNASGNYSPSSAGSDPFRFSEYLQTKPEAEAEASPNTNEDSKPSPQNSSAPSDACELLKKLAGSKRRKSSSSR